jgi:hypothetical protein
MGKSLLASGRGKTHDNCRHCGLIVKEDADAHRRLTFQAVILHTELIQITVVVPNPKSSQNEPYPSMRPCPPYPCRELHVLVFFALLVIMNMLAFGRDESTVLSQPVDVSGDFTSFANTYFLADQLVSFDAQTHSGQLRWSRAKYATSMLFNTMSTHYETVKANEWPGGIYAANPKLPFSIGFVSATTLRIRMQSSTTTKLQREPLMLVREPVDGRLVAGWEG